MTKRRRFIALHGGALTSTIVLTSCRGNPPTKTDAGGSAPTPQSPAAGYADLEVKTVSLGFIPILEAAPLVVGVEKGFFAKHGLEVNLTKQASWPAASDNVVLGTAGGGIECGQWQLPMPQMISEGAITDGKKVPMYILAMLMSQGNGIAASTSVKDANLGTDLKPAAGFFKSFSHKEVRKFRAAYTFPKANQDIWIRYWLAAEGIDPDKEVELLTVPATETVQGLRNGTMELFSTGDPWPTRVVNDKIGYLATTTASIWPVHPEEFLAVRSDWVDKNPKATIALIKGLIEAQQWLDKPENKVEAATMLSSRKWYSIPQPVLEIALKGGYRPGPTPTPETDPRKVCCAGTAIVGSFPIPTRASPCGSCWSRCAGSSIPESSTPSSRRKPSTTRSPVKISGARPPRNLASQPKTSPPHPAAARRPSLTVSPMTRRTPRPTSTA